MPKNSITSDMNPPNGIPINSFELGVGEETTLAGYYFRRPNEDKILVIHPEGERMLVDYSELRTCLHQFWCEKF